MNEPYMVLGMSQYYNRGTVRIPVCAHAWTENILSLHIASNGVVLLVV